MKIPVKIIVDTDTKEFQCEVGSPPVSELIKKETNLDKSSGEPNKNKVANLGIEQIIKIAKMKKESMLVNNLKSAVKSVIGSCNSAGVLVEGKNAKDVNKDIESGTYDKEISEEITETSPEKITILAKQLKAVQAEIAKELEKEKAEKEAEEEEKKKIEEAAAAEAEEEEKPSEEPKEGEEGAEGEAPEESAEDTPPKESSEEKPKEEK
jgi:large subunit ribosomal protein L11